jgi:hypothetical protein
MQLIHLYHQQIIYGLIAIVAGGLAAWIAVTARVKAALSSAAHARTAYKMVNDKYNEAVRDIATLRRQLAQVTAENDRLTGKHTELNDDSDWEKRQAEFDMAAAEFDKSEQANAVAVAVKPSTKQIREEQKSQARVFASQRAASEISQALVDFEGQADQEESKTKHGHFSFRPKPPKEGYRDNTRSSKDE